MSHQLLLIVVAGFVVRGSCHSVHGKQQSPSPTENAKNRWPAIKRLIQSKEYARAARAAVEELEGNYPDRQYAMWKWWETMFGERKDYMELSRRFGECLFEIDDESEASRRRVICEIFDRPKFDVSKSGRDLRAAIESKEKPGCG